MSHAEGRIFKDGEVVAFFEYDGTADMAYPTLRKTQQEVWHNWRKEDFSRRCTCGQPSEVVTIRSFYGAGHEWQGKACLTCMVITEGTNPYPEDDAR